MECICPIYSFILHLKTENDVFVTTRNEENWFWKLIEKSFITTRTWTTKEQKQTTISDSKNTVEREYLKTGESTSIVVTLERKNSFGFWSLRRRSDFFLWSDNATTYSTNYTYCHTWSYFWHNCSAKKKLNQKDPFITSSLWFYDPKQRRFIADYHNTDIGRKCLHSWKKHHSLFGWKSQNILRFDLLITFHSKRRRLVIFPFLERWVSYQMQQEIRCK